MVRRICLGQYADFVVSLYGTYVESPAGNILKIKSKENKNGAIRIVVECNVNGEKKTIGVSRLVATAFINNFEQKPYVIHKDGDSENNYFKNLEWATRIEFRQNNLANNRYKLKDFEFTSENNPKKKVKINPLTGQKIQ